MKYAIIGISLKFPGCENINEYWNILEQNKSIISKHPKNRFNESYFDSYNIPGKMNCEKAGYLKNIFHFDNNYFNISNKEAKNMDVQQRIMLELAEKCIIDSKIDYNDFTNTNTGVIVAGGWPQNYQNIFNDKYNVNQYTCTGSIGCIIANRISYYYNLKGPSFTIDTACSSSGYALHQAINGLKNGDMDMCLVGGINILIPEISVGFSKAKMLSPDSKIRHLDKNANGYVRSEGASFILIKPLDKAIKDKNYIYAVINNTSINQDGKTESITKPSISQQINNINNITKNIDVNKLIYYECHGTGTQVGDYAETKSIGHVLGKKRNNKLLLGSVKPNMGHMECNSLFVSLIKVCLMMKKNKLISNINFEEYNDKINFDELNIDVIKENKTITQKDYFIGINSYGFGGSNFCCLLQNYNNEFENDKKENNLNLIKYSYNDNEFLERNLSLVYEYDEEHFNKSLYNYNKLSSKNYNKFFICKDQNELEELVTFNDESKINIIDGQKISLEKNKICFVFTGQGPQYNKMGIDNYNNFKVFRETIDKIDHLWKQESGYSFIDKTKMFKNKNQNKEINLNEPLYGQTAMFYYQIAMIELLKYFGIESSINLGHSAGEVSSLYSSNIINLEEAVKICYIRSSLQQKTAYCGRMLMINLSQDNLKKIIDKQNIKLEIAVENSENSCVLSGTEDQINKAIDYFTNEYPNIFKKLIPGCVSFHSESQDKIKNELLEKLKNIKSKINYDRLISSSTIKNSIENINDYFWNNVRNKVEFKNSLSKLKSLDPSCIIEIGPHPTLKYHINTEIEGCNYLFVSKRNQPESRIFLNTLAKLYLQGYQVKLNNFGIKNNIHNFDFEFNSKVLKVENKFVENKLNNILTKNKIINIDQYSYFKDHNLNNNIIIPTVGYFNIIYDYFKCEYINFENIKLVNQYDIVNKKYINLELDRNNNILSLSDNNQQYINLDYINRKENIDFSLDLDIFKNNYLYKNYYEILKNNMIHFRNKLKNVTSYKINNTKNKIIAFVNSNYENYFKILDIGLTNGLIIIGYTYSCFIPSQLSKLYYDPNEKINCVYSELIEKTNKYVLFNSYFLFNKKIVGFMKNIKCINITKYNNNLYKLKTININEKFNDKNLSKIKHLLDNTNLEFTKNNYVKSLINENICNKNDLYSEQKLEKINLKLNDSTNYYYNYKNNNCKFFAKPKLGLKENYVLINNKFSAINFKDIMVKIGKVKAKSVGLEFSGVVEKSYSKKFKKGDLVFGRSEYCFSNYIICHEDNLFNIPQNKNLEFSSVFPIVYGTAYLALFEKARIKNDDKILIHSGASSFGLACIEFAKLFDVKIYATTGTENKKKYLESIGIKNIANSRDENTWDNVFKDTKFDIIINCLSDNKLIKNFEFIKDNGIIVDVSKRDSIENNKINLNPFLKSVSYIGLHFDYLLDSHNSYIKNCMYKVIKMIEQEKIGDIPYKKFSISKIDDAMNYMSKGEHYGKVILEVDDFKPKELLYDNFIFDPTKYYLVTGGNSEFSLKLVEWMITKGGNKFLLLSRSGIPKNEILYQKICKESKIINLVCDITDKLKLKDIINKYEIDGYFHTANIYNDKINKEYNKEEINQIWNPKAIGMKNLDEITRNKNNYTYMLAFTSISGYLGNYGQSIYSAANGYVEDIMIQRNKDSIPGIALALGPVIGTGILDKNYDLREILHKKHLNFIWIQDILEKLPDILNQKEPALLISNQDWNILKLNTNFILDDLIIKNKLENEIKPEYKLINYIKKITEINNLDLNVSLISLGIDSLISISITNFCKVELNLEVKQSDLLNGLSINDLIKFIYNNKDNKENKDDKDDKDNKDDKDDKDDNYFNDQINYDINEHLNEINHEIDDKINDEIKWNQEDVNKLLETAEEELRKENTKCKYYLYSILFGLVSYYFYY